MSVHTIHEMIEWIEANLDSGITLSEMSNAVGYSSYYCSNKFHEVLGISFKTYILKRRLSRASKELLCTDKRILDIALIYGYSSQAAFSRAFSKEYGYTPKQFRILSPQINRYPKVDSI